MRAEIIDYGQRYRGIDVGKIHEQCRYLETQLHIARSNEKALESDLFEFKDRVEAIGIQKGLNKPLTKKELALRKKTPWKPQVDLEIMCK